MLLASRIQIFLLVLLLATAFFFRFWQLRDYVVFLGDEGRDMLVMRKIFVEKDLPFFGPTASVGGFYLGPIYYWMAAPFLLLTGFDPSGPSYFVAIVGFLTVLVLFKFIKDSLGFWPATLASFLYATAPLIVRYSRSSWNPNPLPFFALLLIYFIYLGITKKKMYFFLLSGACFGIVIQLHYLATILVAIATAIILVNSSYKKWAIIISLFVLGFLVTFSPFLLFEIHNNFPNFRTIMEFVSRGSTVGFKSLNLVWSISDTGRIFLEELTKIKIVALTKFSFWFLTLLAILGLFKNWQEPKKKLIFTIGIIWFLGGLAGLRFYKGQVFDYYFGFMFPAPFILFAIVIQQLQKNIFSKLLAATLTFALFSFFIYNGFYRTPPNRLLNQTSDVANLIIEKSEGKPFNFGLISDSNSDHAYRYFLEIKDKKPTELEELVTDQLLVVCEAKNCQPLINPAWEIAGFGRAEIAGEWDLDQIGIKIFKLTHWPGAPNPAGKPAVKGG